jgi:hypothetical protein
VSEFTESMPYELYDDGRVVVPRSMDRVYVGGAWDALERDRAMHEPGYQGVGRRSEQFYLGFRCARSASP